MSDTGSKDSISIEASLLFDNYVRVEKLQYISKFAKTSTIATILAPLISIPIYAPTIDAWRFGTWFALMALCVMVRMYLISCLDENKSIVTNFRLLNSGVGIVSLVWGLGWLFLIQEPTLVNNLLYNFICLVVLFVGIVGYSINVKTFYCFVLPLKIPEFIFLAIYFHSMEWSFAASSVAIFFVAIKISLVFSESWLKSISLRYKNDQLIKDLSQERDISHAANVAKSAFIATASHDLRQPMQAINIYLELINPSRLEGNEKSLINKVKISIEHLNKMFNTLLDISKFDANKVETSALLFNADTFVSDLQMLFLPLATQKSIELKCVRPNFDVMGDKALLQQILRNLISNAIQYTNEGTVEVELLSPSGNLIIEVRDTGSGIPQNEIELIQNEFFRGQNTRSMHDGLGLGLSIVSRITKLIGATLVIESEVGKGSIFRVNTSYITSVHHKEIDPSYIRLDIENSPFVAPGSDLKLFKSRHLAIIEDDIELREAYRQLFTSAGFTVHVIPISYSDLSQTLKEIDQIDFILSDFRFGEMTGIDFIQAIREEFNCDIPALIVTADTSPQHITMFSELEIEVLYKPVQPLQIKDFLQKYFSQQ